ncbi:DNA primase large subunit PriL [Halomarina oriensis]|uniref:DNA primase large subunit PriL n=1 Tax=Halomarina oriensis TaxID=671145 RepID=A0A6B0GRG4_9EURY|nr:DNA primase large subunit PriL [Halomarina oriensis]MWG34715.1 DNA primase [Halomarina oriensis]
MDAHHARYPFFESARQAVGEAGVDLVTLIREGHPAVERGRERVQRALVAGTVEQASDQRVDARTEVLSYPIARVLVSLVDAPGAVEKYAASEAATAHERFVEEFERGRQSTLGGDPLTVETVLREFDLAGVVRSHDDEFRVAVGTYLDLAPEGSGWRLVTRELDDGWVTVTRRDLYDLLDRAVERRVAEGLPLTVPEEIADPLGPVVSEVESALATASYPRSFDRVDPGQFPPCMRGLLERARSDEEDLGASGRFALVSFLSSLGMDGDAVTTLVGVADESLTYTADRLDGGLYPPPSCATMQAYGDCLDPDDRCETIDHPLEYYADALEAE